VAPIVVSFVLSCTVVDQVYKLFLSFTVVIKLYFGLRSSFLQLRCDSRALCVMCYVLNASLIFSVLALNLEGVHDVKLHHPSSSVATSNQ